MLNIKPPSNEHEFGVMMEMVDSFLRESNVPIHARPMRGCFEISKALNLGLKVFPDEITEPSSGVFTGDDLTLRIFLWFRDRYGEKLKIHMGPGRIILLIKGDPWEVHLPKVWGEVHFFISSTEKSSNQDDDLRLRRIPKVNILDCISGLPEGLAKSLNSTELQGIEEIFFKALQAMELIGEKQGVPMFREVMSDIDASVAHFLAIPPHHGLSKWSSLQATEKALKGYLENKGADFPYTHKLTKLASLASAKGLPPLPDETIKKIQCKAGVRYGEEIVGVNEAYSAHLSSIEVCGIIANNLDKPEK